MLICSCDKNKEIWNPFFSLLNKYWIDRPTECFILAETLISSEKNVKTILRTGAWTNRLLFALEKIETEYVILMLDDFFIMKPVRVEEINRVRHIMDKNENIAVFYFKHISRQSGEVAYENYLEMDSSLKYIVNFQAGIWRTKALKSLIEKNKSPWDIEENANPKIKGNWLFYCANEGSYTNCDNDVIPYLWAIRSGYGVCKGKILWNNKKLFKKNGIKFKPKELKSMSYAEYKLKEFKRKIDCRICKKQ